MDYYFLASLLPELSIGHVPSIGWSELKELLRINLKKEDMAKVKRLLSFIDFQNLLKIWTHEPIDPYGNYSKEELESSLANLTWPDGSAFPPYLQEFLQQYGDDLQRALHFSNLFGKFLEDRAANEEDFLSDFFNFERYMRLIMAGFRAKNLGKNVEKQLQFEDSTDPIVAQIIAQKDAKNYEPPFEFKELKPIFEEWSESPLEMHKALTEYRFDAIQDFYAGHHFSIDNILGYIARLYLAEKWLALDVQEGINVIDKIEGYVR